MRITKKVFTDLAVYMMSFGLLTGVLFPFFVLVTGVPRSYILTPVFIISCILAGLLVGGVNILITKAVVGRRLKLLAKRMKYVDSKLTSGLSSNELSECSHEDCIVPVDSEDEIGESAQAFNDLVHTLSISMINEHAIKAFNVMLSSQLEMDQLADKALNHMVGFMNAGAGAILVEQGGDLEIAASMNIRDPEKLLKNDSVWNVMRYKSGMKISMGKDVIVESPLVSFHPVETRIDPLLYKGLPVGIIVLSAAVPFSNDYNYGYEMFLQGLALSLRNAVTYEQLQKLAANDPLTGLYNRRFGSLRLTEEFTRSTRSSLPLGLIMFDVDHFKIVNDTYGHTVGDKMLVNIARISRMAVREGDFIIRYGGEEFLVILPGASIEDTLFVAERLRHMIEDCSVQHNQQELRVTISAGYTSFPEDSVPDETILVKNADEALYSAKKAGRNRVVKFRS
ncbi:MAG: GGDEF domain-containing protein [Spirochaetia bacterium]|nr:GGDEF domain-containing protein [Spirochaetia bacterium]